MNKAATIALAASALAIGGMGGLGSSPVPSIGFLPGPSSGGSPVDWSWMDKRPPPVRRERTEEEVEERRERKCRRGKKKRRF